MNNLCPVIAHQISIMFLSSSEETGVSTVHSDLVVVEVPVIILNKALPATVYTRSCSKHEYSCKRPSKR